MAEKTDHAHALCVALTYSEDTPEGRDAARMFEYSHVRAFIKRLTSAVRYEVKTKKLNVSSTVRFLCAGEQGDRYGRCHWHLIIYSSVDITRLGEVLGFPKHQVGPRKKVVLSERHDMLTVGKDERRLNWSLWPWGFSTFQEPDQGGMSYVLSYCLKDQFTGEKSHETMRQAKVENFATGLFRMSKRPAIGENFLIRKMEELDAKGAVLPALKLSIPDMGGYWVPGGLFREKLLWYLVALNQRIVWATGANAPQWASLLASCRDNEADLKVLHGETFEEPEESEEFLFAKRSRLFAREAVRADFAKRCGSAIACEWCLHHLEETALLERGIERYENEAGEWEYRSASGYADIEVRRKARGDGINPDCLEKHSREARHAFPRTAPRA